MQAAENTMAVLYGERSAGEFGSARRRQVCSRGLVDFQQLVCAPNAPASLRSLDLDVGEISCLEALQASAGLSDLNIGAAAFSIFPRTVS
jgi:hypothetical protein